MSMGLGPGILYIDNTPLGACYEVGEVGEPEPQIEWPKDNPFISLGNLGEFSGTLRVSKDALAFICGSTDWVFDNCSDRRVVHLFKHGKKYRTRKKNLHRAFRIIEEAAI